MLTVVYVSDCHLKPGASEVLKAAKHGDMQVVTDYINSGGDLTVSEAKHKWTLLHSVAETKHDNIVKALIDAGANARVTDIDGWTPLHNAASAPIAKMLIAAGAYVNATDKDGNTPLHVAALHGQLHIAKALVAAKAHVNAINNAGETPLNVALEAEAKDVAVVLTQHGGRMGVSL